MISTCFVISLCIKLHLNSEVFCSLIVELNVFVRTVDSVVLPCDWACSLAFSDHLAAASLFTMLHPPTQHSLVLPLR